MSKTWTIKALKKHFDSRFKALDKAVNKAEMATEKRFEGVNEFRLQLSDQSRTFMPRTETENMFNGHNEKNEAMFANLTEKIEAITKRLDEVKNIKVGGNIIWLYIVSVMGFLIAVISFLKNGI